jgi:hypothetical protein
MAAITFFLTTITLFSAAVTFFAWRNGRIIKETSLHTQNLIREEMKENRLLLEKISQLIAHIPEKTKELIKE